MQKKLYFPLHRDSHLDMINIVQKLTWALLEADMHMMQFYSSEQFM